MSNVRRFKISSLLRENLVYLILSLLLVVIFFVLRLSKLTYLPIFADEAIYIRWAQVMKAESTLRFLPLSDGKQPLFMWMVIPMLKLFEDPLYAGRVLSVFSGFGTVLGIFALSLYLFKSPRVSLIAAFLYTISPFTLFFDRMALVDSLLTFFGVWTLLLSIIAYRKERLDLAMLSGFSLGGALLTKSPGTFFAPLSAFAIILASWGKSASEKVFQFVKLAGLLLVTLLIGYGIYNILRLGPEFHMIALRNKDYVYPLSHLFSSPKDPLLPFVDRFFEWVIAMGPSLVLLFTLTSFLVEKRKFFRERLFLLGWFLVPILIQAEFAKVFTARYVFFVLPPMFILAGSAFLLRNVFFKKLLYVLLGIVVIQSVRFNYYLLYDIGKAPLPRSERSGYLEEWTSGQGIREVSEYIKSEVLKNPSSQIVIGTEGFFGTLPDGLQIYLNNYRQVIVKGVGVAISDVHPDLLAAKKAGNTTYLLVNSTRFTGNPENLGLRLIAAYPKAFREKGTVEYNLNGPQETLLFYEVTENSLEARGEKKNE